MPTWIYNVEEQCRTEQLKNLWEMLDSVDIKDVSMARAIMKEQNLPGYVDDDTWFVLNKCKEYCDYIGVRVVVPDIDYPYWNDSAHHSTFAQYNEKGINQKHKSYFERFEFWDILHALENKKEKENPNSTIRAYNEIMSCGNGSLGPKHNVDQAQLAIKFDHKGNFTYKYPLSKGLYHNINGIWYLKQDSWS